MAARRAHWEGLYQVRKVAQDWQRFGSGTVRDLPAFLGIGLAWIDVPAANILGLAAAAGDLRLISINTYVRDTPLEPYVIAHEVSHFLLGLCDSAADAEGQLEACSTTAFRQCELLAWSGASLFALPTDPRQRPSLLRASAVRVRREVETQLTQPGPLVSRGLVDAAAQLERLARRCAAELPRK